MKTILLLVVSALVVSVVATGQKVSGNIDLFYSMWSTEVACKDLRPGINVYDIIYT